MYTQFDKEIFNNRSGMTHVISVEKNSAAQQLYMQTRSI